MRKGIPDIGSMIPGHLMNRGLKDGGIEIGKRIARTGQSDTPNSL